MEAPGPRRKATCVPAGAGGLPEVKPLLFAEIPAPPVNVQGEPVGRYLNWPAPTCTCSNPGSAIEELDLAASVTASTKAVLSPPALSRAWKAIVCDPAVTVNTAVV